eukprot:m51a1_g12364 hypothetical protein (761) ;mRNA; f:580269-582847
MTTTFRSAWHPHLLTLCTRDNGWACDGRSQAGGCRRGITGFHQTSGVTRFRCEQCDYDLCPDCIAASISPSEVVSASHEHTLKLSSRNTSWYCNGKYLAGGCKGKSSSGTGRVRYRCDACDFDFCPDCLVFRCQQAQQASATSAPQPSKPSGPSPVSPSEQTTAIVVCHSHRLSRSTRDNGWGCDGRKNSGGCRRGITGFNQTSGVPRYRCDGCDYDLCSDCLVDMLTTPYVMTRLHEHTLSKSPSGSTWTCSGASAPGGCRKARDGNMSSRVVRYRCDACSFNLCPDCILSWCACFDGSDPEIQRAKNEAERKEREAREEAERKARLAEEERVAQEKARIEREERTRREMEEKQREEERLRQERQRQEREEQEQEARRKTEGRPTTARVAVEEHAKVSRVGSASRRQRSVVCAIEYMGSKFRLDLNVVNLQGVVDALCGKVGADPQASQIEVRDDDLEDFFVLDSIDMLKEKARIRISPAPARNTISRDTSSRRLPSAAGARGGAAGLPSAPPRGTVANRRMCAPVEEQLGLRDYLRFPKGFSPKFSCRDELTKNAKVLELVDADHMITTITDYIEDLKFADPPEMKLLDSNELFALVAYTYDLGYAKPEDNLYFKLNADLRQRMKAKMEAWWGYLFYLMGGLQKLPDVNETLYRGVPVDKAKAVEKEYASGRRIRWTAFSSTTKDLTVAANNFAGPGGVVFRITCSSGRDLQNISYIKGEGEILLSPNVTFRVKRPVHNEDGVLFLDLVEEPSGVLVF